MWTAVELRELCIFLAVAEELHFGRAAERLQISQPGVSEAIRSLETHLGGRLFERTSRRVCLTPAGEQLQRKVAPICQELERVLAETSDMAAGVVGTLRIGFTATTDTPPLSRLVAAFQSRHPDCQISLHEVDTWNPYHALRRGDIDVLVNWLAADEPDLTTGPAVSLHDRILVVARSHRLADRSSVQMEDLADEQVALPPPSYPDALYDAILPPHTSSGRPITRAQAIRSISETAAYVAHGKIVHITMAGVPVFSRDDVALIPLQDLDPIPLGLVWCTARRSSKIHALADTARSLGPFRVTHSPAPAGMSENRPRPNQRAKVAK